MRSCKSSPLPWSRAQYTGTAGINDANGESVADAVSDVNAELILGAVNRKAAIVSVLRDLAEIRDDGEPCWCGEWYCEG